MSPKDYKEKMRPLIITIIVCVVFLIFVNIWSQKQIKVIEEARPVIKEEPKERAITPTEQIVVEEEIEAKASRVDKIEELVNAQYQAYSRESEEEKASPTSKYSIHPSEEELQRIKENKHLMQ